MCGSDSGGRSCETVVVLVRKHMHDMKTKKKTMRKIERGKIDGNGNSI